MTPIVKNINQTILLTVFRLPSKNYRPDLKLYMTFEENITQEITYDYTLSNCRISFKSVVKHINFIY